MVTWLETEKQRDIPARTRGDTRSTSLWEDNVVRLLLEWNAVASLKSRRTPPPCVSFMYPVASSECFRDFLEDTEAS